MTQMVKRILLLNLVPNTIGDNILLTPILSILKDHYSLSKIDMTVSPLNIDIFANNPNLNKIYSINELKYIADRDRNKLSKFFIYMKIILKYSYIFRKTKYDLCLLYLPNFPLNVLIPKLANIKKIVGYSYKNSFLKFLLTKKITYRGINETKDYERHFVESYLDLLRINNIKFTNKQIVSRVYLTENEITNTKNLLKKYNLFENQYICFQSGSKDNSWPIMRFLSLAKEILKSTKYKIVLLGSKSEYNLNQKIAYKNNNIINLSGKTSLRETMAILKLAKFSICNDSGLAHMSSAVGTKTIVLFGPHSPKHCTPIGLGKVIPIYKFSNDFPYVVRGSAEGINRINAISVLDVMKKMKKLF